jgi:cytochrome oxidase assembly protein ShyY1
LGVAIIAAAVCVRLGFWQLHRRTERKARNALIMSRLDSAAVDVSALPHDSAFARFRRARVTGMPDYEHELIFAARSYRGSPGVNFLTPPLDEGPHLNYAIQWFAFAAIALVGAVVVVRQQREDPSPATRPSS